MEFEEKKSVEVEVEGDDDDDDDDGGENIALLPNEAHPRAADAVHLFSRKINIELSTS